MGVGGGKRPEAPHCWLCRREMGGLCPVEGAEPPEGAAAPDTWV